MKKKVIISSIIIIFVLTISSTIFYYKQNYTNAYNSFEDIDRTVTADDIKELGYGDIPIYQELKLNSEIRWKKNFNKKVGIFVSYMVESDNYDDDFDYGREYAKELFNWTKKNIDGKHCRYGPNPGGFAHISYRYYYGAGSEVENFEEVYKEYDKEGMWTRKGIDLSYLIKVPSKYLFRNSEDSYLKIDFNCHKVKSGEKIIRIVCLAVEQIFCD